MCAASMVMFDEYPEPATQIPLAEYDHVVEAFAAESFRSPARRMPAAMASAEPTVPAESQRL